MPEILIEYNRFLDPVFIAYIKSQSRFKDWEVPSIEEVLARIQNYKNEWDKEGNLILESLCQVTNLNFNRNAIDVYIVSGNPRTFSNPIVIKSGFDPSEFVDTLTHELIHRLFTLSKVKKDKMFSSKYENETDIVKNHILLHAILKYIYLDILKDTGRLDKNIGRSKRHSTNEYSRAWEIVEIEGYKELINNFISMNR
jgi:hypothetical protein